MISFRPVEYAVGQGKRTTACLILLAWIIACFISLPMYIDINTFSGWAHTISNPDSTRTCSVPVDPDSRGYVLYAGVAAFVVPTILLSSLYAAVGYKMHQRQKKKIGQARVDLKMAAKIELNRSEMGSRVDVDVNQGEDGGLGKEGHGGDRTFKAVSEVRATAEAASVNGGAINSSSGQNLVVPHRNTNHPAVVNASSEPAKIIKVQSLAAPVNQEHNLAAPVSQVHPDLDSRSSWRRDTENSDMHHSGLEILRQFDVNELEDVHIVLGGKKSKMLDKAKRKLR